MRTGPTAPRVHVAKGPDRRSGSVTFRVHERRFGFDRRHPPRSSWRRRYQRLLERYHNDQVLIAEVLAVFALLNLADLVLTLDALSGGATEANPVMAWLFDLAPAIAAAFKLVVGLAIAVVVWVFRRYRRVLEVSLLLVAVMTGVLVYHAWFLFI